MSRLSFSHTLLASFLLIAAILGGAAVGGVLALEDFAARSRDRAADALDYTAAMQQLAERSVDMERSARQYLVLEDPVLRERFEQARSDSVAALERIGAIGAPDISALIAEWLAAARAAAAVLDAGAPAQDAPAEAAPADATQADAARTDATRTDATRTEAVQSDTARTGAAQAVLARLAPLNERLAAQIQAQIEGDAHQLLDELDGNRRALARQVFAALVLASVLAAATGWWVLRPLNRVEAAIEALGESRLDQPVKIGGPADLRRVGRRLDWLRLRLADLEANRARVLRHVSHELKTPLASVREGVALLEDGVVGALSPQQGEVVGILRHNAQALQERIEGLLGYNAAVFDARSLRRRPVALRELAESVVAEQRLTAQARGVRLAVAGDAARAEVDEEKLRIALGNLVANAVSFSPPGGEVAVTIAARPGRVDIDCTDQGPGVSPDEAERIFEPFFQGSRQPVLPRHGSGLGLSIVREFVAAHGGRVHLLSGEAGAHFRIELPHES